MLNATHSPNLSSWVKSAQGSDFPIQNLPYGICQHGMVVAIGDQALVMRQALPHLSLSKELVHACQADKLNDLMALDKTSWTTLRVTLSQALSDTRFAESLNKCLLPQSELQMQVPANIGDYSDFFTSLHHATNVGKMFRPDNPLLPNYKHVPIGYHGRASSIVVSGTPVRRPIGQTLPAGVTEPIVGPSRRLDYEFELGIWLGKGNPLGEPIPMNEAEDHLFGLCLFNDWSARDVQAWEYQPLGPFLAKSFASSISPWIVTWEALAPFRVPFVRAEGEPTPLAYLQHASLAQNGALAVQLEATLSSAKARSEGKPATVICQGSYDQASYWSPLHLVAHHAMNGCNLRPGDMFASGTLSGPQRGQEGSLLEASMGGKQALTLSTGEERRFLEDGDQIVLRAWAQNENYRIGFGECIGEITSNIVKVID